MHSMISLFSWGRRSVLILLAQAALGAACTLWASPFSGVIAIGDSLSDRANTINEIGYDPLISYFSHYDETYYNSAYNQYAIPAAGRWSSGPTWVEYLTGSLNTGAVGAVPVDLGANPDTNATAKNFAWAGSTSGTGYTTIGGIYDLANYRTQISNYVTIMSNGLLPAPQTALMTLWSGGNDAIYWVQAGTYTVEGMQATAKAAADNVAYGLMDLYGAGARNFLVPNLPALGEKPNFRIDADKRYWANEFANYFNLTLAADLDSLIAPEANIYKLDIHTLFDDLIARPTNYGLTNATDQAWTYGVVEDVIVDHPELYLFWDSTHPTTQVHQILGNEAYLLVVPEPGPAVLVLFGLMALLAVRSCNRRFTRMREARR